jgi:hypothetical protein
VPRTTITPGGHESLIAHDTPASWHSFLSIDVHERENERTKEALATISNADDGKLYLTNNNTRTRAPRSGDNPGSSIVYTPFGFLVALANASADRIQTVELSFDNVDRRLLDVLRFADYPIQIDYALGMVLTVNFTAASPLAEAEGFELYVLDLQLREVRWNKDTITGTLARDDVMTLAFPSNHPYYDHTNFPGLYGLDGLVTDAT